MELKNGETYNGHLVNCDNWMNISLKEVICTSRVSKVVDVVIVMFISCLCVCMCGVCVRGWVGVCVL